MTKEQKEQAVEVVKVTNENESTENKTEIEVIAEEKQGIFSNLKNGVKKNWKKGLALVAGVTAVTVGVLKVVSSLKDDEDSEDDDYVTYIELNETESSESEDN